MIKGSSELWSAVVPKEPQEVEGEAAWPLVVTVLGVGDAVPVTVAAELGEGVGSLVECSGDVPQPATSSAAATRVTTVRIPSR